MTVTLKNNFVPDASTPWPQGWAKSIDSAGTILREASIDSARERLTLAETMLAGPTDETPWYFMVHDNLYIAKGDKTSAGKWVLTCANEVEAYEKAYTGGANVTVGTNGFSEMLSFPLPVRPYRRLVEVHAFAYGIATGVVNLATFITGYDSTLRQSRFSTGSPTSVAVADIARIEADQSVTVRVGIRGDSGGGGSVSLTGNQQHNEAFVKCYPLSMA